MATQWLTPAQAAEYVGCHIGRIYDAADAGDLEAYVKPWCKRAEIVVGAEDIDRWVRSWPSAKGVKS